ncbi:UDP-N-acetylmuramoylalanyl-D-glutamate--2,6-diaminopimelate ligase [Salinisphaera orenii MK-B5]|uniref:UDP-N-acetylmuramoyl-tripeptide--D-alanyl-D-alanine ligase n=1 Tax=Salinisphaera orenii MK-B5 TaxID=856730 RepID=A0A423PHL2_9GAMM|nr:UDP-N-acetylmuramoyl-tripeptide--D-alanyl-D-alanine ligase [Salinisphaera orenii]ROO25033.1 UDP-N-acetylmuramoylalanyl-D-glutamate--2,6-diaminopimelate ligase [Salinisphaera orenii MK-B5]
MNGRLSRLAEVLDADLHGADGDFAGASIDTRRLPRGALFFALAGERVDGHDFVAKAASLGAAAAVVAHRVDARLPQLEVADVAAALTRAGAEARARFDGPVVGVTGSNGKTTVKQMLAAILGAAGPVLATEGNLNNHLGVPLTLMRLDGRVERAVIEMGASAPGEIAELAAIARPSVGVITNAGDAHLEGFGSRDGVARGKSELYAALADDGVAVINADDAYTDYWREVAGARRVLTFGREAEAADVRAVDVVMDGRGSRFTLVLPGETVAVTLPLAGAHNVSNALAAAAGAHAVGVAGATIARALAGLEAVGGRLAITAGRHGVHLVDDSYNANPGSLAAALGWLAQQPAPRWAVLGDMGELGEHAQAAHRDAGAAAREAGIDRLWATGPQSRLSVEAFGDGGAWFADHDALNAALLEALDGEEVPVTILVKGSRSARMDRIADALRIAPEAKAGAPC